ncbi:hypothetical protein V8C26DRAFT_393299 [Trichoderma gracile]
MLLFRTLFCIYNLFLITGISQCQHTRETCRKKNDVTLASRAAIEESHPANKLIHSPPKCSHTSGSPCTFLLLFFPSLFLPPLLIIKAIITAYSGNATACDSCICPFLIVGFRNIEKLLQQRTQ